MPYVSIAAHGQGIDCANAANGRFIVEEGGVTVSSMEEFSKKMVTLLGTDRIGDAPSRKAMGQTIRT